MISFSSSGSFANMERFLAKVQSGQIFAALSQYARTGVAALASATPMDSGTTANSWTYEIELSGASCQITWINTNVVGGKPLAIMLQYGHGTGTGGYVAGRDYINPAIRPVFDRIADAVWKEVTSA
jgi:hypothetical protein